MSDLTSAEMKTAALLSFFAALREADSTLHAVPGARVSANHASLAGLYLHAAGGDAERARSMLLEGGAFMNQVADILDGIVQAERAERGPKLKTGT